MGNPKVTPASWNMYTGVHSIQFLNGNNLSGVKFGANTNTPQTSYNVMGLGGYDSSTKQPCFVALGTVEQKYNPDNNKVWVSQELYGEALVEKGVFASKVTYTPVKVNAQLGKVNVSFTPRAAVNFNGEGITPRIETLTTVAAPLTKDNKLSAYALFQTYDTAHLFSPGTNNNMSINAGLTYTF